MGNTVRSVGSTMLGGVACCATTGAAVVSRPNIIDIGRPSAKVIAVRFMTLIVSGLGGQIKAFGTTYLVSLMPFCR